MKLSEEDAGKTDTAPFKSNENDIPRPAETAHQEGENDVETGIMALRISRKLQQYTNQKLKWIRIRYWELEVK